MSSEICEATGYGKQFGSANYPALLDCMFQYLTSGCREKINYPYETDKGEGSLFSLIGRDRTTIDEYNKASHKVALEMLELMVESLRETIKNPAQFHDYLTEHSGVLRINHYPRSEQPSQDIGLPPHIDDSLLTIVHQGDEVAGLEVRKGSRWVSVQPMQDALVVIVAAVCQVYIDLQTYIWN